MASFFSPIRETARGFTAYLKGVKWLKEHPGYIALLAVPILLGFIFLVGGITVFSAFDQQVLKWILFEEPQSAMSLAWFVYQACKMLLYIAMIVFTLAASLLLMNVIASPIYDHISLAVERDVLGTDTPGLGFMDTLRVMVVELKKVVFILFLSALLLVVPGLNVISTLIAAFLVGWDFFDYPLARRGWSFRQRLRLVTSDFWAVMGFGLWLVIPFAQIVMLPLAVAGGTMLNLESLKREQLLTPVLNREKA
jgi:uncharacterized protein involved in cysteine biosynthesis